MDVYVFRWPLCSSSDNNLWMFYPQTRCYGCPTSDLSVSSDLSLCPTLKVLSCFSIWVLIVLFVVPMYADLQPQGILFTHLLTMGPSDLFSEALLRHCRIVMEVLLFFDVVFT